MAFGLALTESCHNCRCDAVVDSAGGPDATERVEVAIAVRVAEKSEVLRAEEGG